MSRDLWCELFLPKLRKQRFTYIFFKKTLRQIRILKGQCQQSKSKIINLTLEEEEIRDVGRFHIWCRTYESDIARQNVTLWEGDGVEKMEKCHIETKCHSVGVAAAWNRRKMSQRGHFVTIQVKKGGCNVTVTNVLPWGRMDAESLVVPSGV